MAYKKTITITVDSGVHQALIDLGYSGSISQICEDSLRKITSGTKKEVVDRLKEVPEEYLLKAKRRMKDNPPHYAKIWSEIINDRCKTEITPEDLLGRFYPGKEWKK